MRDRRVWVCVGALVCLGCTPLRTDPDASTSASDASMDAGSDDDAGGIDLDGGSDGGAEVDTGPVDTGPVDTGPADAGPADAGSDPCDVDGDGYRALDCSGDDCDDTDPRIHPDAVEVCDDVDDDCDPDTVGDTDLDADGSVSDRCCNPLPSGDATCGRDCDDTRRLVNERAPELTCNDIDDNCDGRIDEGSLRCWVDLDRDGHAALDAVMTATSCSDCPLGTTGVPPTTDSHDCDDADALTFPGQTRFFGMPRSGGGYDYDCDGSERLEIPRIGSCATTPGAICSRSRCTLSRGWEDSVRGCGERGPMVTDCACEMPPVECRTVVGPSPVTQRCH